MMHTTKDGAKIRIKDMSDTHLLNTIRWIERRSTEGVTVMTGGIASDDIWFDTYTATGECALEKLNYAAYKKEAAKRKLT